MYVWIRNYILFKKIEMGFFSGSWIIINKIRGDVCGNRVRFLWELCVKEYLLCGGIDILYVRKN